MRVYRLGVGLTVRNSFIYGIPAIKKRLEIPFGLMRPNNYRGFGWVKIVTSASSITRLGRAVQRVVRGFMAG